MKNYTSISDIKNINQIISEAISLKASPFKYKTIGRNKTLIMLFFNASLRTRLSTEKAAKNLGMDCITLNVNDTWRLEFEDGNIMNFETSEHIKEAAKVISQYADIIGIRAFPELKDKAKDESEYILKSFKQYASVPVINLESATAHPLQALTDAMTIKELTIKPKSKVVLSWVPHPKALPQAVANSFIEIMQLQNIDLVITHPKGYELNSDLLKDTQIEYNQEDAFNDADFIYAKNWSSYKSYGKVLSKDNSWMITKSKLGKAKFMHCLPVRRNVVVEDAVLDSNNSVVIHQANNRTFAAQAILKQILQSLV